MLDAFILLKSSFFKNDGTFDYFIMVCCTGTAVGLGSALLDSGSATLLWNMLNACASGR